MRHLLLEVDASGGGGEGCIESESETEGVNQFKVKKAGEKHLSKKESEAWLSEFVVDCGAGVGRLQTSIPCS